MIRFMFPGCKTVYEVDNSFAGQNVKCENCCPQDGGTDVIS